MSEKQNVTDLAKERAKRQKQPDANTYEVKNSETLEQAAAQYGYKFRYNSRAAEMEIIGGKIKRWEPLTDSLVAQLLESIEMQFRYRSEGGRTRALRFSNEEFDRAIKALSVRQSFDPFRSYLSELPAWDHVPRVHSLFTTVFNSDSDELSQYMAKHIFLGVITRAYEPGFLIREVPILVGPQAIGKSALLRHLFPIENQSAWFSDSYQLHESDTKTRVESTLGCCVVEISEMTGLRKAELERVKQDLTAVKDRVRLAYARHVSRIQRQFIFVGTSNRRDFLPNDPSGNSRFVPIDCPAGKGSVEEFMAEHREQFWAESLCLYHAGERPVLLRSLIGQAAARAEKFRDIDETVETDLAAVLPSMTHVPWPSLAQIVEAIGLNPKKRGDEARVSTALRRGGWESEKDRVRRYWRPKYDVTPVAPL